MKRLEDGVYDVTDKAASAAQRMGWSAVYLSLLWVGTTIVGVVARLFIKRGS
jgi:hypothetical protein